MPAAAATMAAAWRACVEHDGPTALVLSRQNLTVCTDGSAVARGAGIVVAVDDPQVVIVATGSEVPLSVTAIQTRWGGGGVSEPRNTSCASGSISPAVTVILDR
jgi:transketolase